MRWACWRGGPWRGPGTITGGLGETAPTVVPGQGVPVQGVPVQGVPGQGRRRSDRFMRVTATVNGVRHEADDVWPGESLLYVLRERMGLPGSKNACEQGECGSCTIYLDGVPVCACLVAAGQAQERSVVTIEGLAGGTRVRTADADTRPGPEDGPDPVQQAFLDAGPVQCGL